MHKRYAPRMKIHSNMREALELAKVRHLQEWVDRATEGLSYTTIRSPIDGYVTDLRSELGEIVMGSLNYQASVIMVVSDLSAIDITSERNKVRERCL